MVVLLYAFLLFLFLGIEYKPVWAEISYVRESRSPPAHNTCSFWVVASHQTCSPCMGATHFFPLFGVRNGRIWAGGGKSAPAFRVHRFPPNYIRCRLKTVNSRHCSRSIAVLQLKKYRKTSKYLCQTWVWVWVYSRAHVGAHNSFTNCLVVTKYTCSAFAFPSPHMAWNSSLGLTHPCDLEHP